LTADAASIDGYWRLALSYRTESQGVYKSTQIVVRELYPEGGTNRMAGMISMAAPDSKGTGRAPGGENAAEEPG